jgi:hypothetical protein
LNYINLIPGAPSQLSPKLLPGLKTVLKDAQRPAYIRH